jgi:tetratricopeptide (TPR) repeat protein
MAIILFDYPWVALSQLYVSAGRFNDALALADRHLLDVGDHSPRLARKVLSYATWPLNEAGRWAEVLERLDPWMRRTDLTADDKWVLRAIRMRALVNADSLKAAGRAHAELFDSDLFVDGAFRSRYYIQLAELDLRLGLPGSALAHVREAERHGLRPGGTYDWSRRVLRARALAMVKKYDEAEKVYRDLTSVYAGWAPGWYYWAECDVERGDHEAARRHLERFFELYAHADHDAPLLIAARERERQLPR